jgi:hypothetical protein
MREQCVIEQLHANGAQSNIKLDRLIDDSRSRRSETETQAQTGRQGASSTAKQGGGGDD